MIVFYLRLPATAFFLYLTSLLWYSPHAFHNKSFFFHDMSEEKSN